MEIQERYNFMYKAYLGTIIHEGIEKKLIVDKNCSGSLKDIKRKAKLSKEAFPDAVIIFYQKFSNGWQEIKVNY